MELKNCETFQYIKLKPKNIEEMYDVFFHNIYYNLELILILVKTKNFLCELNSDVKKSIILIIKYIDNIINTLCKDNNYYSLYTQDYIFYSCIPFYDDFNNISIIKISDGIDFKSFMEITLETSNEKIINETINLIHKLSYYINH